MAVGSGLPVRRSPLLQTEIQPVANVSFEAARAFQQIAETVGAVEDRFLDKRLDAAAQEKAAEDAAAGEFQERRSILGALTEAGSRYDEVYNSTVKAAYLSRARLDARTEISGHVRDNPEDLDLLRAKLDGVRQSFIRNAPFEQAAVQDILNQEIERAYSGALDLKQRRIDANDEADIRSAIADRESDLVGLARSGAAGSDEYQAILAEIDGQIEALRADPRFNVSDGEAALMRNELRSKASAESAVAGVAQIYRRQGKAAAEQAARAAFNDPDLELSAGERDHFLNRALGEIGRMESERRIAAAEARAKAAASLEARLAAASRGEDGSRFISDAEIIRVFGEDAPAVMARLNAADMIYADQSFAASASPEDVAAEVASRAAAADEALKAGDANRYLIERARLSNYQTALEKKREALASDPVGYLQQFAGADAADPEAMIARQQAAGALPGEIRVLSNAVRDEIARQISEQPDGLSKLSVIEGVKQSFGKRADMALSELAEAGVPEPMIIGASIAGAADRRAFFQSFDEKDEDLRTAVIRSGGVDPIKKTDAAVASAMSGFRSTIDHQAAIGGAAAAAQYEDAVRRLAWIKIRQGLSPDKAAASAYQAIIASNYAVADTIRAPRTKLAERQVSEAALQRANQRKSEILKDFAIVPRKSRTLPDGDKATADAYRKDIIARGYFATLPDESGVGLFDAEGDPVMTPVFGGSRQITLTWDRFARYGARPAAAPVPFIPAPF